MQDKILLYGSNGEKMGETFARRAKQLVKRQRARWTDEAKTAIRFEPDAGDWTEDSDTGDDSDDSEAASEALPSAEPAQASHDFDDSALVELAKKRIKERRRFVFHTLAFLPGWFVAFLFSVMVHGTFSRNAGMLMFAFITGAWLTAYTIHFYQFAARRHRQWLKRLSPNGEGRRARKLAAEVDMLRAELQGSGVR